MAQAPNRHRLRHRRALNLGSTRIARDMRAHVILAKPEMAESRGVGSSALRQGVDDFTERALILNPVEHERTEGSVVASWPEGLSEVAK